MIAEGYKYKINFVCPKCKHFFTGQTNNDYPIDEIFTCPNCKNVMEFDKFNWRDCYKSYLNLDHRTDRLEHMVTELKRVGIEAYRTKGFLPKDYDLTDPKLQVMKNRTPGAIGCHYGQVFIMDEALYEGKSAFVMEDDLIFCSDIQERLDYIQTFLNKNPWDVFWLGGTYHRDPPWWHDKGHKNLPECNCDLGRDYELTDDPRIVRTYGAFSTFAYIVNYHSIEKILKLLEDNVHKSMGIDWLFILLQPGLKTYAFVPGCVKQMDNRSDIGNGDTIFSGFRKLGAHWWADRMY